jgi:hypothetical protein
MSVMTALEPLSVDQTQELFERLDESATDDGTALAVDEDGRVLGLVGPDDGRAEHAVDDLRASA